MQTVRLLAKIWVFHFVLGVGASANFALAQGIDLDAGAPEIPVNAPDKSARDLVVFPIPISNPTIGTGLALTAALFYKIGQASNPSLTGVGAFLTSNNSWGFGVYQKANLAGDRFRLTAMFGYASLKYDFFGTGNAAAARGISIPITQQGFMVIPRALVRVKGPLYAGLQYRFLRADTTIRISDISFGGELPGQLPNLPDQLPEISDPEIGVTSAGLGPIVQYDSRDSEFGPTKGWMVEFKTNFSRGAVGSDFSYESYTLAINHFRQVGENKVLAFHVSGCRVTGRVPFFDLCLFGTGNDLRGYEGGRYRDKAMFAAQAEFRWRFWKKFGLVTFVGVGAVAKDFGEFKGDELLPAGGAGLRYLASEEYGVNVSVDFAVGKDISAFYFRIGEAF